VWAQIDSVFLAQLNRPYTCRTALALAHRTAGTVAHKQWAGATAQSGTHW
jgi:hypothetical protein